MAANRGAPARRRGGPQRGRIEGHGQAAGAGGVVEHGPGADTGTDRWLEKSRKKQWDASRGLPGHDRRNLNDVMQQKKGGGRDGTDAWLARKGKHCFQELPIQKSNRKSLYSVMQHDAKGSMDAGQRVGDKWLDTKLKNPVRHRRYSGHPDGDIYGLLTHTNVGPRVPREIC